MFCDVMPLEVTFRKCGHKGMQTNNNQQKEFPLTSVLLTIDVETRWDGSVDSGW